MTRYKNTYDSTNKMKHVDVKPSTYIYSSKENNQKNPILKTGDIVTISKYENDFEKGHTLHWSEEFLWLKKLKVLCRGKMLLMILTVKKLLEFFTKKIANNKSKDIYNWKSTTEKRLKIVC